MINRYLVENLFGIKGLNIAWYGVIIGFGILSGILIACREAKRQNLKTDIIFDFFILALPLAIICARLYYVIFEWEQYRGNFMKMVAIWEGGLAIYGGVIGGFLAAVIFCKLSKFPIWRLIDMVVPSLILGQAIGRWGNFVIRRHSGTWLQTRISSSSPTLFSSSGWENGIRLHFSTKACGIYACLLY